MRIDASSPWSSTCAAGIVRRAGVLLTIAGASACGGGGGGGGGSSSPFDSHATLLSITFPDPLDVNPEPPDAPPGDAPLAQQIVFTFSGNPDPARVGVDTLSIRDAQEFPVPGSYHVDGPVVTFTPTLPTRPITKLSDTVFDSGGAGLSPGSAYVVRAGPATFSFISNVAPTLLVRYPDPIDRSGVLLGFKTTSDPARFHSGLGATAPRLVATDPADGATGVSPDLYSDPDHLFAARRTFALRFDAPVDPALDNVGDSSFRLIDLDDPTAAFPAGLPLGIDATVLENDLDHSVVEVSASGVLPFGHLLALEIPTDLRGLSQSAPLSGSSSIASSFTTADTTSSPVNDDLVENFDTNDRDETSPSQLATGTVLADWNRDGSGILQAGFAFQGDGILGRFEPPPPKAGNTKTITLDTGQQQFPLFDGSTPDSPPGFVVNGGVFPFTDIDIPDGVIIQPIGPNPLVFTATGSVHLAGQILVPGQDGTPENAHDSAVTSTPGGNSGVGGGRGGEGHPILFFPPDQVSLLSLVSPPYGGRGFGVDPRDGALKRIGGIGGQCGMLDHADANGNLTTDQEISCIEAISSNSNGVKPPGGGGGSFLTKGLTPTWAQGYGPPKGGTRIDGIGNVLVDGQGHYIVRPEAEQTLLCGDGGDSPFPDDQNTLNNFIGPLGQVQRLIGGQGGGAGASRIESYYCGIWCQRDSDPSNDGNCNGTDFGTNPSFADSVGDARGGGAGGGGGVVMIQALGAITIDTTAVIDAHGGNGMGGEQIGCSNFAGGAGGGSGGAVILQSGTSIVVQAGAILDVSRGDGDSASAGDKAFDCDEGDPNAIGDGGAGGAGLIQLQVPAGSTAVVVDVKNSLIPYTSWVDSSNVLNPATFTPYSIALTKWYDLGRMVARTPLGTHPAFAFSGLDALGYVQTDSNGFVLDPAHTDIVCDYLGQIDPITHQYKSGEEPRADFIPTNARVKVEFQGADALVDGSKEIDPGSITLWSPLVDVADGHQFVRWRVTFNIAASGSDPLGPDSRRPAVQEVGLHAQY